MLAKSVPAIPQDADYTYEPKWDGFRAIVFRDGETVELGSRNEKPLTRYFPEVVEAIKRNTPQRCVLDGEIVIAGTNGLDFDALTQRIHPAASRVAKLAEATPASFVAFDLLASDIDLRERSYEYRRSQLEALLSKASAPVYVTPVTQSYDVASKWFVDFEGAGLDGIVAKRNQLKYQENKRVMLKIKHQRSADCVVAGFRWHKSGGVIGSLLLGLFDENGLLHHVGVTASFTAARRAELVEELAPYRVDDLSGHPWQSWAEVTQGSRQPGGTSRWNAKKDLSWQPLRAELVCEVAYDHMQNDRFRHATTFKRWRVERDPASCTYLQLDSPVPSLLSEVFSAE